MRGDRLAALDRHQLAQQRHQLALHRLRLGLEHLFGAVADRPFEPAQFAIGGEGQTARLAAPLPQLVEQERKERQRAAVAHGGLADRLVEAVPAGGIVLEAQPRFERRLADDLADLRFVRRHQQIARFTGRQRDQPRHRLKPVEEVAAHRRDDPDEAAFRERVERGDEGGSRSRRPSRSIVKISSS